MQPTAFATLLRRVVIINNNLRIPCEIEALQCAIIFERRLIAAE